MSFHKLGHDLVFLLDLGFEQFDFLDVGMFVHLGLSSIGEGEVSVLEELFEPIVDLIGMKLEFIAEIGNGDFVDEMPLVDGDLLVIRKVSSCLVYLEPPYRL